VSLILFVISGRTAKKHWGLEWRTEDNETTTCNEC